MTDTAITTETAPGAPFQSERKADPCALVIFGGTGDLARRKLVPGLYNLARDRLLPDGFSVVGIGRSVADTEAFRALHRESTQRFSRTRFDAGVWEEFAGRISFLNGDLSQPETFARLAQHLSGIDAVRDTRGNRLFFLAIPPAEFPQV